MSFENLRFDNSYERLPERFYSRVAPNPPSDPVALHLNPDGARLIGLEPETLDLEKALPILGGYELLEGMSPIAAVYAGHQFGHFVPQLGDGRAVLLGEVVSASGRFDLNLKGSGMTPYSRRGDGRAVIRSTVREYLVGEAFAGLGVPTSRSLCMVTANERVWREEIEPTASMIRLAPSFVRFGTFEFFHARGDFEAVKILADYVIDLHFPHLKEKEERYILFFYEVVQRTAELMADWQTHGFVHGVMNTDNMSILGLSIDYGPYGFLDDFIKARVFNHTDQGGRYAYNQQPNVGLWNLKALAHALSSLLTFETADYVLSQYWPIHRSAYAVKMGRRLGIDPITSEDVDLINRILSAIEQGRADYTHALRGLYYEVSGEPRPAHWKVDIRALMGEPLFARYEARISGMEKDKVIGLLKTANPKFILRSHHLDEAIEKVEEGDLSVLDDWLEVLRNPFEEHAAFSRFSEAPKHDPGGSVLSCSS